jgi:ATPase subunit of ABC transporter with duplicated ATPase domains
MGALEVTRLTWSRPGGRLLFQDVSFRVGDRQKVALVGDNGVGKTTLLRLLAGDIDGADGEVRVDGRLGVMRQFVGTVDQGTVRDLLVALSPPQVVAAAAQLATVDPADGVAYAHALAEWGDAGGYDAEVMWDVATTAALGLSLDVVADRPVTTLSGGEQKRLALELLLRGEADVLLLDEPDNYLDIPAKLWLEGALRASAKTILFVSHDRELLAAVADKVVTLEARGAWTHGAGFATYHHARADRLAQLDDAHRRYAEERQRLVDMMREFKRRSAGSDKFASRARATETRLRRFDAAGPPPEQPRDQRVAMRLKGGRTGKRALRVEALELGGLVKPFDTEIWFGERVGVLGRNGTGKSHFLKLLAGQPVDHAGDWSLGARVVTGHFSQTHDHPELQDKEVLDILHAADLTRLPAMQALGRYELEGCAGQTFRTLSGGQQARLQILLLELAGANLLLLDEPTDNLDLVSAEALEEGLSAFEGTVVAVTHDRWLMRTFDRFLVFGADGTVRESFKPIYR